VDGDVVVVADVVVVMDEVGVVDVWASSSSRPASIGDHPMMTFT
jgi:hypothetical protein